MTIKMRYLPAYGLAVYDTNGVDDDGPMINPGAYPSRVKFHSGLYYPTLQTRLPDVSVTLPAQTNIVGTGTAAVAKGTYQTGVVTLGAHGQTTPPIIKAMLVNYNGANRPLQGSFPVQQVGNMCRVIDVGVDGGNVVLVYRGWTQAGAGALSYPAVTFTVRVWVFNWVIDGSPDLYNPSLPQLQFTASKIQVGRGRFDTDYDYIRSATGAENSLLTRGETWTISGSNANTTNPGWGWRYSVDGYTMQGQVAGSGTADFTRIQLP